MAKTKTAGFERLMVPAGFEYRHAKLKDVGQIKNLINQYAAKGEMLPKSLSDLYEGIRNFWVITKGQKVTGVCALQVVWEDLSEIKSLAVASGSQGLGLGRFLVMRCIEEAREFGIKKIFTLTYKPDFFKKAGFKMIPRDQLPHKVWNECIRCVKFPDCDENAMTLELR